MANDGANYFSQNKKGEHEDELIRLDALETESNQPQRAISANELLYQDIFARKMMLPPKKTANVPKVRIVPGTPGDGERPHSAFFYVGTPMVLPSSEDHETELLFQIDRRPSTASSYSSSQYTRNRLDTKESDWTLPPLSSAGKDGRRRPSTSNSRVHWIQTGTPDSTSNQRSDSPASSLMSLGGHLAVDAKVGSEKTSASPNDSENMSPYEEGSIPKELAKIKRNQLIGASADTSWIDSMGVKQILARPSLEVRGSTNTTTMLPDETMVESPPSRLSMVQSRMEVDPQENPTAFIQQTARTSARMLTAMALTSPLPAMPVPASALHGSVDFRQCLWDGCHVRCFQNVDLLMRHVIQDHIVKDTSTFSPSEPESPRRKIFVCRWADCLRKGIPFTARYKLVNHMRTHTGEKPIKCSLVGCEKAFTSAESLKIHLTSHTGERPYNCDSCDKTFSNRSDRSRHRRTHVDQRPFVCNYPGCEKRYTDPSSLRKHSKVHNNANHHASNSMDSSVAVAASPREHPVKNCLTVHSFQQPLVGVVMTTTTPAQTPLSPSHHHQTTSTTVAAAAATALSNLIAHNHQNYHMYQQQSNLIATSPYHPSVKLSPLTTTPATNTALLVIDGLSAHRF